MAGTLTGQALGDTQIDHARTMVALGDTAAARRDLDLALANVPDDPLAWLLSATLARRSDDPARAKTDIAEAIKRAPADAAVRLEAGNIAAKAGDEPGARAAWAEAVRLAPASAQGRSAAAALAQFEPATPASR
ncbi:tetratricopeptide repeat protein [Sphingomonas sp. Tas61C01]|uniref:tetratricopeptide repeat protein n=1 Tax=Sphingomonas sp. Tas61C01 TaxID=3458297 RepID=UPI00403ECCA5